MNYRGYGIAKPDLNSRYDPMTEKAIAQLAD